MGGAVGGAYSTFLRRVATIMARSRVRHITFFQAHAIRQPIHAHEEVEVMNPMFNEDEDFIDIEENDVGPISSNDPLVIETRGSSVKIFPDPVVC